MVQVVKTTKFFGMDVSEINEVYTAEIYGREFIIHPSVVASNGWKFEFPVNGCEIIKIAGSIIVVPGEKVMTFFSAGEESHIEDTYGCGCGCQVIYHTIFEVSIPYRYKQNHLLMLFIDGYLLVSIPYRYKQNYGCIFIFVFRFSSQSPIGTNKTFCATGSECYRA